MRQQIHAELATWVPDNPKCQMALLSRQQICQLLTNMTIYFIGDSLMRQMFMSVFGLLRDDILLDSTPQANRNICDHYNRYFTDCTPHILRDSRECEGEVHLMSQSLWRASQSKNILEVMGQLTGKNNSLFVFGIGLHDGLDHNVVESQVLKPMFELMSKSPWPKVIWVTPHVPGPLKSGRYVHQQAAKMEVYNQVMHQVMRKQGIPVLDFLHLTDGVMSYDGTHFGKGLNDVKAHIFLNFLLENRKHFVHNV
ncbi:uncharacterized protein LOC131935552 [Physella acuta]|uniref:uncharacterized protein LOC131935552 n=1 Tax=Physella acuta TaxID=109671 RepID=UPI0027DC54CD|nr:uncharacterized protein LOC131935552 [Physella acuta]